MMFDEAQVFEGLTAWFSTSVPASLKSQWVKSGGLFSSEFGDADYIFSNNASAKDTLRIFDSNTYHNEELTIFNSSLIEDTVANGKGCLSGKYSGAHILIHPAYQTEIDNFCKQKCPRLYRSNVRLTGMEDGKQNGPSKTKVKKSMNRPEKCNVGEDLDEWEFEDKSSSEILKEVKRNVVEPTGDDHSDVWDFKDESDICPTRRNTRKKPIEGVTTEHQNTEQEHSDEWDFQDDPDLNVKNLKDARNKSVQSDKNGLKLRHSPHLNYNSAAAKQTRVDTLTDITSENARNLFNNPRKTLSTFSISDGSNCSQPDREQNSQCGHDSTELVEQSRGQRMYRGECQEKAESGLQDEEQRESFLDDAELKDKVSPDANFRSHFLSSMDDGFVHIDDIALPDIPIYDFIPNHAGCRVDAK